MKYTYLRFPGGKPKAVTLSFDDGPRDDIKLVSIMEKYGIKGTFNINSSHMGKSETDWALTPKEIKKYILDTGNEVAVHGEYHIAPGRVTPIIGITDVLNCRKALEDEFGIIIKGMAYPDSGIRKMTGETTYEKIRNYLSDLGIVYARTLGEDNADFALPRDFLAWMPTSYHKNPSLFDMIDKFLLPMGDKRSYRDPRLFYIWGHSYEFRVDNNWDIIEKACEKLGGKEDIWYATNMEIYNYVTGYNRLVFSSDSKTVYNPNLFDVWFEIDGELFSVKSGETLKVKLENEQF